VSITPRSMLFFSPNAFPPPFRCKVLAPYRFDSLQLSTLIDRPPLFSSSFFPKPCRTTLKFFFSKAPDPRSRTTTSRIAPSPATPHIFLRNDWLFQKIFAVTVAIVSVGASSQTLRIRLFGNFLARLNVGCAPSRLTTLQISRPNAVRV